MALGCTFEHVLEKREPYDKSAVFINEHLSVAK